MTFSLRITIVALSVLLATATAASAVQTQVMIQGYLTNASGTPYTTVQATEFRVYQGGNAAVAGTGTLYYDETANITPSGSGVFNYPLGSGSPTVPFLVVGAGGTIPNVLSTTTFDTSSPVFLEISVGGVVMLPRLQMLGTPYAAIAGVSESLKPTGQPLITTSFLQASSGTFTAMGAGQASIVTSSSIVVNAGQITAPAFVGTLYGNVVGNAGSVSAASVTPGTFGGGVLVPPGNIVGGIASTNTVNTFPLAQYFPGGVVASSGSFSNGVTAPFGTFMGNGPNQASVITSSSIVVNGGQITAPAFYGTFYGSVNGNAGSVSAASVSSGTFGGGVLVPPQNVIGGIASTNTVNTFPLAQYFPGGIVSNSESVSNGVTAASGTFTASGPNQASVVTSSSIFVNGGGVTAPYFSGTFVGNGAGITGVAASNIAAANVLSGTLNPGVSVNAGSLTNGPVASALLPSTVAYTSLANTFPLAQSFPGGIVASSGAFSNGITAPFGTLTGNGSNLASLVTSSGVIVNGGGVTAPYFSGAFIGSGAGITGVAASNVAAANVLNGTLNPGVSVNAGSITNGPVASSLLPSTVAYTSTANTFPLAQSFQGGVTGSSAAFTNGITAASGTFTSGGANQASVFASSSIIVAAGGVTAPYFSGSFIGNGAGLTGVAASNIAAANVQGGTLNPAVSVNAGSLVNGPVASALLPSTVAYTSLDNAFSSDQTIAPVGDAQVRVGGVYSGPTSGYGANGQETSRHQLVFPSWSNVVPNTLGAKLVAINKTAYGSAPWYLSQSTELHLFLLQQGALSADNTVDLFQFTPNGAFTAAGGVVANSGSFANGVTAMSGTFSASGQNQASVVTSSSIIVNAGQVTAPAFVGTLYGNVIGNAGSVAAGSVTPGTFGTDVLVPPQNIIGGIASTNTVNTFPLVQTFSGGLVASSGSFTSGVTAASGTFTAGGPNQASVVTSSSIIVNAGQVVAPAFVGTLYGNVIGNAGSVAAGSVTPGTFGAGVLIPLANIVGGAASTNTVNTFALVQTFSGGVVSNSESVLNGVTAGSGTFTASGPNQASVVTSSGIIVSGGGVTAPFFSGSFVGNGAGITGVSASYVAAGSVTPGTLGVGVLVPPQNVIGGIASTNTVNTFALTQTFSGGLVSNSENVLNGVTASSGTFTAVGPNQASLVTSSGVIVNGGGVTAPFFSGSFVGNGSGITGVSASNVAAGSVTAGTFGIGVLVPPQNIIGGIASTNTVNTFPLAQYFPGGVAASSGSFTSGVTAASGTFTATGPNQASLVTSSGVIVNGGGVTAPFFSGSFVGNGSGITGVSASNVAAGSVTAGTFGGGVLVPPQNIIGGIASTNTINTFPLAQYFTGGVVASSGSFAYGVTAATGTFTASGPNQASILTSSSIIVNGGGVTAPFFSGSFVGNGAGITGVVAANVAAINVQNGTLNPGVLVDAGSLANGPIASTLLPSTVAYTSLDNEFSSDQTIAPVGDAQARVGGVYSGPLYGYSANGQETSRHQVVFPSWSNVVNNTLGAKLVAINKTAYGSAPWYLSQTTELHLFLLQQGALTADSTVDLFQFTPNGAFTAAGGVVANSGSFANGVTAASATFTASGQNQASVVASSGIVVSAGGVTAPFFSGAFVGNGSGVTGVTAANVAAANVTGAVAVLNGGTGATTAAGAQTSLGVPSTTGGGASGTWGISITGNAASATSSPPIGAIILYAGSAEPVGWIECDGRSIAQTGLVGASWGSYNPAPLYAAIGSAWGYSGPSVFNAPDLRGIFPRGWNHGKSSGFYDVDASTRVAQYAGGATGDAIGSYEKDQFRSHTHSDLKMTNVGGGYSSGGDSLNSQQPGASATGAAGGDETRPMNASVMYIMRVQ